MHAFGDQPLTVLDNPAVGVGEAAHPDGITRLGLPGDIRDPKQLGRRFPAVERDVHAADEVATAAPTGERLKSLADLCAAAQHHVRLGDGPEYAIPRET